jgi:hypothetical protein
MTGINHAAVWLAGIAHFLLGAAWYTAFGELWLEGVGKSKEQLMTESGGLPTPYIIAVVAALIIAYTLARVLSRLEVRSAAGGALTGALLALGFIGAAIATNYGFEVRPVSLWLINTGYLVVGMAIMGAIIAPWKKKAKVVVPLG